MKRATKIAGAGFYILKGKGAKLQRALIQFMLDFHEKNGLIEINPPQLVNTKTAFGTGNLPKFEDQLYKTNEGFILIPTAEVSVTNIYANEVLIEKELPIKFCSFTECYRTEVGKKMGEEGLYRVHQFEKVEMVYFCKQEDSNKLLVTETSAVGIRINPSFVLYNWSSNLGKLPVPKAVFVLTNCGGLISIKPFFS